MEKDIEFSLDDSSDEDDIKEDDIKLSWKDLLEKKINTTILSENIYLAQYIGNSLFRTPKIRKEYIELKKKFFKENSNFENLSKKIFENCKTIIGNLFSLRTDLDRTKELSENLKKDFCSMYAKEIQEIFNQITTKLIETHYKEFWFDFKYNKTKKKEKATYLKPKLINEFSLKFKEILPKFIQNISEKYHKYQFPTPKGIKREDFIKQIEKSQLFRQFSAKVELIKNQYPDLKQTIKTMEISKIDYEILNLTPLDPDKSKIQNLFKDNYDNTPKNTQIINFFGKIFEKLPTNYFDLIIESELELNKGIIKKKDELYFINQNYLEISNSSKPRVFKTIIDQIKENIPHLIPLTSEVIKSLVKDVDISLQESFQEINLDFIQIQRNTGETQLKFQIEESYQLFAFLRFNNRFSNRIIKDLIDKSKEKKYVKNIIFICLQFRNNSIIHENDEINNSKNYSRLSKIEELESYSRIVTILEEIKYAKTKFVNLSETLIVQSMRDIIQGKDEVALEFFYKKYKMGDCQEIMKFLICLSYQLFGVESIRNPSSFIINQMALDLIELGFKDFSQLSEIIPMSKEGSISRARGKNEIFKNDPKCRYFYSGPSDDPTILIEDEHKIVKLWNNYCTEYSKKSMSENIIRWYGNIF